MLNRIVLASAVAVLLVACTDTPTQPTAATSQPSFSKSSAGAWVAKVSGGGTSTVGNVTEWINLEVQEDAAGTVSGNIEYANVGYQGWRYHLSPDCMLITPDGKGAVIIGSRTLSQGPNAPAPGTTVAFLIQDNGNGNNVDRARTYFAGSATCADFLPLLPTASNEVTSGNYTISQR